MYGENEMHGAGAGRGSDAGGENMGRMRGGMDAGKRTDMGKGTVSMCVCTGFSPGSL